MPLDRPDPSQKKPAETPETAENGEISPEQLQLEEEITETRAQRAALGETIAEQTQEKPKEVREYPSQDAIRSEVVQGIQASGYQVVDYQLQNGQVTATLSHKSLDIPNATLTVNLCDAETFKTDPNAVLFHGSMVSYPYAKDTPPALFTNNRHTENFSPTAINAIATNFIVPNKINDLDQDLETVPDNQGLLINGKFLLKTDELPFTLNRLLHPGNFEKFETVLTFQASDPSEIPVAQIVEVVREPIKEKIENEAPEQQSSGPSTNTPS